MCTTTDSLLQEIKALRRTKFYKTAKPVVKYLLTEVEEIIHDGKIAVNRGRKQDSITRLFEIQFSDFTPIRIHTICKSGAAHIKCYEKCVGDDLEKTVVQIKTVCEKLNWHVEQDRVGGRHVHEMKIGCCIQKEVTP